MVFPLLPLHFHDFPDSQVGEKATNVMLQAASAAARSFFSEEHVTSQELIQCSGHGRRHLNCSSAKPTPQKSWPSPLSPLRPFTANEAKIRKG